MGGGGGLANADVIRGGGRSMLTGGRGGDRICQNLADVICERSLTRKIIIVNLIFYQRI